MKEETIKEHLQDKTKNVPTGPGCYLWMGPDNVKSSENIVLYVGKALNLRSRVKQYLNSRDYKTKYLMKKVRDLDWIVTNNEVEALLLESNLIKKHSPQYNVRLKDDKRYPYLCLTLGEKYPRLIITRKKTNPDHAYFGPYSDAGAAKSTYALIHRIFPIRKRALKLPLKNPAKPCLNYHIGRCLSPCSGKADDEEYSKLISEIKDFLEGKSKELLERLESQMKTYSAATEYEKARRQRDILSDVNTLYADQAVHQELPGDHADIVGLYCVRQEELALALDLDSELFQYTGSANNHILGQVVLLRIRNGNLVNKSSYALTESHEKEGSLEENFSQDYLEAFFREYYLQLPYIPPYIYSSEVIGNRKEWEDALTSRSGKVVNLLDEKSNKVDYKKKNSLIAMAVNNARLTLRERILSEKVRNQKYGLRQIQKFLKLPNSLKNIEVYDISNIQGKQAVGAGITIRDGILYKAGYRKYKIQTKDTPDDPAMMYEMLYRRLAKFSDGGLEKPDLIVLDGGITQMNAVKQAKRELGVTVPLISLAKREEEVYREDGSVLKMDKNSPGMLILRMGRDEVHRFAVSYHRVLRSKKQYSSVIDNIKGIGPKRRKQIMSIIKEPGAHTSDKTQGLLEELPGINRDLAEEILTRIREE